MALEETAGPLIEWPRGLQSRRPQRRPSGAPDCRRPSPRLPCFGLRVDGRKEVWR